MIMIMIMVVVVLLVAVLAVTMARQMMPLLLLLLLLLMLSVSSQSSLSSSSSSASSASLILFAFTAAALATTSAAAASPFPLDAPTATCITRRQQQHHRLQHLHQPLGFLVSGNVTSVIRVPSFHAEDAEDAEDADAADAAADAAGRAAGGRGASGRASDIVMFSVLDSSSCTHRDIVQWKLIHQLHRIRSRLLAGELFGNVSMSLIIVDISDSPHPKLQKHATKAIDTTDATKATKATDEPGKEDGHNYQSDYLQNEVQYVHRPSISHQEAVNVALETLQNRYLPTQLFAANAAADDVLAVWVSPGSLYKAAYFEFILHANAQQQRQQQQQQQHTRENSQPQGAQTTVVSMPPMAVVGINVMDSTLFQIRPAQTLTAQQATATATATATAAAPATSDDITAATSAPADAANANVGDSFDGGSVIYSFGCRRATKFETPTKPLNRCEWFINMRTFWQHKCTWAVSSAEPIRVSDLFHCKGQQGLTAKDLYANAYAHSGALGGGAFLSMADTPSRQEIPRQLRTANSNVTDEVLRMCPTAISVENWLSSFEELTNYRCIDDPGITSPPNSRNPRDDWMSAVRKIQT